MTEASTTRSNATGPSPAGPGMTGPDGGKDLIVAFPAAGSGGATLEHLEKLAARRGMAFLAGENPTSVDAFATGRWQEETIARIKDVATAEHAGRVALVGHCMGGLSAIHLAEGLTVALAVPVGLLVANTPCPDPQGRIPTMSQATDATIADLLAHDGFPQDLLEDEDMLAEIADGLRADAAIADRLAEWAATAEDLEDLYVLSTRGDAFIPPEQCAGWRLRVTREFHLEVVNGGHTLDESLSGVLDRALDTVLASALAEAA